MRELTINRGSLLNVIPLVGIICFIILYIVAALIYPGGNYLNPSQKGFSILHNYWCDLLNEKAGNGETNPASPLAIAAMVILCVSLMFLWYNIPKLFLINNTFKKIIQVSGIISMAIALFIFTRFHSEAITYAGLFGGIAFMATFIGLYRSRRYTLFALGIICLVLGVVTYTIYNTRVFLIILPFIQKVTLLLCLVWLVLIDNRRRRTA